MRLHDWYVESQKKLAKLKADLPKAERNASQFINMPGDHEDMDKWNKMKEDTAAEQARIRKYEKAWKKNRTTPPSPVRTFAGRYGPL
jgi:hypothetical protein